MRLVRNTLIEALANEWDEYDPVANAILALIESQNAFQNTGYATLEERDDGTFATDVELNAAFDARADAVVELIAAQMACWREFISPVSDELWQIAEGRIPDRGVTRRSKRRPHRHKGSARPDRRAEGHRKRN